MPSTRLDDPRVHDPFSIAEKLLLALLTLLPAALLMVLHGDVELVEHLMREDGPVENASAVFWLLLSIVILLWQRPLGRHALALAAVSLVFCLRELDLHKIIADTSMLKINFYRDPHITAGQKLLGGVIATGVIGLVAWGLTINLRAYWRLKLYRRDWGRIVLVCAFLLPLSKVLDRLPATVQTDLGYSMTWTQRKLITVPEELLECLVPGGLLVATWLALKRRPAPPPLR